MDWRDRAEMMRGQGFPPDAELDLERMTLDWPNDAWCEVCEGKMIGPRPVHDCTYDDEPEGFLCQLELQVCPACDGRGSYVRPSIDAHGITQDEWDRDWSYEDRERYMGGFYDVSCASCKGRTTVPGPIRGEHTSEGQKAAVKAWDDYLKDMADMHREMAAERRHGC